MSTYCVEVHSRTPPAPPGDLNIVEALREAGAVGLDSAHKIRLFILDGLVPRDAVTAAARELVDPLTEVAVIRGAGDPAQLMSGEAAFEVYLRPGVMDPVAETTVAELRSAGLAIDAVRSARRYVTRGAVPEKALRAAAARVLANDCIEELVVGAAPVRPFPQPPQYTFALRTIALRGLDDAELEKLARAGHLFLSVEEMRAVQAHFSDLNRDPTDLELETIAQTWSEHCVHKTLRSAFVYRGAALPPGSDEATKRRSDEVPPAAAEVELRYGNLLKDTIVRATETIRAAGRGPECLSVFKDNAGIVAFDDEYGVAFKVETHNHPSAIEPYGGAATGVGGCIRDILGCGLAARPIANTDVFCVAPAEWPMTALPRGVHHPWRVLRGVVAGVADYGNRMGIPTVNGAVCVDPRYLANPLVFCGCVGLIPRDRIEKAARPGDRIVLIGGRTGRDGIHGATFSSAELTDTHADEFSHAVQIGNAITEKRVQDALLAARDDVDPSRPGSPARCLFSAVTDCGAGGLSSAVGEMAAEIGAIVELERVPLKYAGLRYDEIWVSEAQERMVVAVPPDRLERFLHIMRDEEVEATVIGAFGASPDATGAGAPEQSRTQNQESRIEAPRLIVRFNGVTVGDLDLTFLHNGLPRRERVAIWRSAPVSSADPGQPVAAPLTTESALAELCVRLASANVASREWIIRQYDHEVQGGSVVKPLCGPHDGPSDAAVLRPRLEALRGIAVGCGLAPHLGDVDPYWMAVAAIDEALRNVVCVGGDPRRTAILDNFCWGRSDDEANLGALVRACQGCHDAAVAYGTPFISGKDSLNNEFLLDPRDVPALLDALRAFAAGGGPSVAHLRMHLPAIEERIRASGRLAIPPTLLISALALVADVRRCCTADLKQPGNALLLVGGLPQIGTALDAAARVHTAVAAAIAADSVRACHDVSDGGWLVTVAEMALAAGLGVELGADVGEAPGCFEALNAAYVVEAVDASAVTERFAANQVRVRTVGVATAEPHVRWDGQTMPLSVLRAAWRSGKGNARLPPAAP